MSGGDACEGAVGRTRDGVPKWDGSAATFAEYEELAAIYEQGVSWSKRSTVAPRLAAELSGSARRLISGRPVDWLSSPDGVSRLLATLREGLGRPQISDFTDHLDRYFRKTRRKQGEGMNDFITRKQESYLRAMQGFHRVLRDRGMQTGGSRQSFRGGASDYGLHSRNSTTENSSQDGQEEAEQPRQGGVLPEADQRSQEWTWRGYNTWGNWWSASPWNSGWDWSGHHTGDAWSGHYNSGWSSRGSWQPEAQENLLPSFVQGWYMLHDSGLDTRARNAVITALQGNFEVSRVAQELRNQWSEADLKRHDAGSRHTSFLAGEEEAFDEDMDGDFGSSYVPEDFNEEGQAILAATDAEVQDALAAIKHGRRTLKEARARQHQVKMSRQYYRTKGAGSQGAASKRDDSAMTCLRCGRVGHRVANCPEKPLAERQQSANIVKEEAPFVCFADGGESSEQALVSQSGASSRLLSTAEATRLGMCVVDPGATKTVGSVTALEHVMAANQRDRGRSGVQAVDQQTRPTFSFGNSTTNQCLSTLSLELQADGKAGSLAVHALDAGEGPVLLSIATLRKLGAVIDYETDTAVFRTLNPRKVVPVSYTHLRAHET